MRHDCQHLTNQTKDSQIDVLIFRKLSVENGIIVTFSLHCTVHMGKIILQLPAIACYILCHLVHSPPYTLSMYVDLAEEKVC